MIAVVQRVARARVTVEGEDVGRIGPGMVVLLGVLEGDEPARATRLAERIAHFRFFGDADDRMNRSVLESGGACLAVSQFTLAADGRKGRRPSFDRAAPAAQAQPLYDAFVDALRARGVPTETGRFGARMQVELVGDGPVTFVLREPA